MTKFQLKTILAMTMMIFLAASCGKDKKKSANNQCLGLYTAYCNMYSNPYTGYPGGYQQTANMPAAITNWHAAPDMVFMPGVAGLIDFSNGNQFFASSDYCYRRTNTGTYDIGQYNKVNGTNFCSGMVPYSKANNTKLQEALNGAANGLTLVGVQQQGTQYALYYTFSAAGGYAQPTKVYVIDIAAHSMLNPVVVQDLQAGQREYLYGVKAQNDLVFQ